MAFLQGDGHRPSNLARRRPQDQQSCKATATGPAMIEVGSAGAKAAIECDLNCYGTQWRQLQLDEVENAYGPLVPEAGDIEDLKRNGTCIQHVTLHRVKNSIQATWLGDVGEQIKEGSSIVISRNHPKIDTFRWAVVASRGEHELQFRARAEDADLEEGT